MIHVPSFAFRDTFAGERIPTLEEAVEECIKLKLSIYFDVKGHPDEVGTHTTQSRLLVFYFTEDKISVSVNILVLALLLHRP